MNNERSSGGCRFSVCYMLLCTASPGTLTFSKYQYFGDIFWYNFHLSYNQSAGVNQSSHPATLLYNLWIRTNKSGIRLVPEMAPKIALSGQHGEVETQAYRDGPVKLLWSSSSEKVPELRKLALVEYCWVDTRCPTSTKKISPHFDTTRCLTFDTGIDRLIFLCHLQQILATLSQLVWGII